MSNRFHNKFHRHNHHTVATSGPLYPDSAYDPIASRESPFKGEFYAADQITTNDSLSARQNVYATNAQISGDATVDNNLLIRGESQFNGRVFVNDDFTVTAPSLFNGSVNVDGNTNLNGTLFVENFSQFNSTVEILGDLVVSSNMEVLGSLTTLDTQVIVTSAMEITNAGSEPALRVNQEGQQPVAHFFDDNNSAFIIQGTSNAPGFVGINTATPNERLTVVGNISAEGNFVSTGTAYVSGNTNVRGDLEVAGADVTTASTGTATLFNTNATTINLGGAATLLNIGSATGNTNINNNLMVDARLSADGDFITTGTAYVSGNLSVKGDLEVAGADITTAATGTATLFNTNAVTLNIGGAATALSIGNASGTVTIPGDLAVNGSDITTTGTGTATLFNTNATTVNIAGAATAVAVGNSGGTVTIPGDLAVNGADITTTGTGTATLFNTNATTLNIGGAATALSIGNAGGTVTVPGDLAVNGADITTTATGTANLFNTNATTLNVGGAATTLEIGKVDANTTVNINGTKASTAFNNGALVVDGGIGVAGSIYTQNNLNSLQWSNATTVVQSNSAVWNGTLYGILNDSSVSTVVDGLSSINFTNPIGLSASRTYELTVFADLSGAVVGNNSFILLSANRPFTGGGRVTYYNLTDKTVLDSAVYGTSVPLLSVVGNTVTPNQTKSFTFDFIVTTTASDTTFIAAVSSAPVGTNTVRGFSPGTFWKARALS